MSGDFLDSNVFVYLFDETNERKRDTAERILESALQTGSASISFQVAQRDSERSHSQNSNADDGRRREKLHGRNLDAVAAGLAEHGALQSGARYPGTLPLQFSYDSLVIAAALDAGCTRLYTEDLQDGQRIESLTIENPFRD